MRTLFLLSACLLMAACTGRSSQASNDDEAKPVITVTLEPQRYFTEAIAGDIQSSQHGPQRFQPGNL